MLEIVIMIVVGSDNASQVASELPLLPVETVAQSPSWPPPGAAAQSAPKKANTGTVGDGSKGASPGAGGINRPTSPADDKVGESAALLPEAQKAVLDVIDELDPIQLPLNVLDVMLGPIREANLLLPERLDPFDEPVPENTTSGPSTATTAEEPSRFTPSQQSALLGNRLATRTDTPDELARWNWRWEAGGSFRQGNSSHTNVHSLTQAERHSVRLDLLLKAALTYNRASSDDTNRRAIGEFLSDRNLRGRWIWYAREELEYDEVKLLDLRSVSSSGLGFRFIDRLDSRLVARTGPTASYVLYDPKAQNDDEFRTGWLVEGDYRRVLGDAVRLEFASAMFPDFDSEQQFRVRNEGGILFPIGGKKSHWNWKIGAKHEYQLDPVRSTRSSDVEGYFSISYAH